MLSEEPEEVVGSDAEDGDKDGLEEDTADDADEHFQEEQVTGNAAPEDGLRQRAVQWDGIAVRMLFFIHDYTTFPLEQAENGSPAGTAFDDVDEVRCEQAGRYGEDEDDELERQKRRAAQMARREAQRTAGEAHRKKSTRG